MLTLAFFNFGPTELVVFGIIALLVFGRRLPEVGKNLGKGIVEFKKGLAGIDDDVTKNAAAPQQQQPVQPQQPTVVVTPQQPRQFAPPANAVSHGSTQQPQPVQAGTVVDSNQQHQA